MKKQRIIRCLSALLCLCLLAGFAPAAMAYSNVSDWAKSEVAEMEALGLLPDCLLNADLSANITRGEMCKMAVEVYENLMNVEASCASGARYFTDTQEMEINFAFEQGIINGYEDQTFRPNEPLSRQDFFKITYNLMTRAVLEGRERRAVRPFPVYGRSLRQRLCARADAVYGRTRRGARHRHGP